MIRGTSRAKIARHRPRLGRAFSYLELVVVLIIIAITASIAVPRYSEAIARHRADETVRRVLGDFTLAQQHARIQGAGQGIAFNVSASSYTLTGMPDLRKSTAEYTVSLADDPYGAQILSADFGGDTTLRYNGYGVPDSDGTIVIRVGNQVRGVRIGADNAPAEVVEEEAKEGDEETGLIDGVLGLLGL